jgi:hypothetical protein
MTPAPLSSPMSAVTGIAIGNHLSRALGWSSWASYAFGCPDDFSRMEGR